MNVKKLYYIIKNYKLNLTANIKRCIIEPSIKAELKKNTQFKNIHKGKRCFILGNGPSLKKEDLSLLRNEYVFTVNQANRNEYFPYIKSNYHFWADPDFFVIDINKEEDLELLHVMKSVNTKDNIPICFFPIEQRKFVEKFGLAKDLRIHYFYSCLIFYDGYKKDVNYSKIVPSFSTVVQWCITMAIYMGFKEIYLLGCDNTGLLMNINTALQKNNTNDYAYTWTENEKLRMQRMLQRQGLEQQIQSALGTFQGYSALYKYCKQRNIKLVNCSAETLIDSIPRAKFSDVIKEKQTSEKEK